MSLADRKNIREHAHSLVISLRTGKIDPLANALQDALATDLVMERLAITQKTRDAIEASAETSSRLQWLMNLARDTMHAIRSAPLSHADGEVFVHGIAMTPDAACGFATRIVEEAYHAQTSCDRAIELTRRTLRPQPIVAIQ
jgi:hypothetical protein